MTSGRYIGQKRQPIVEQVVNITGIAERIAPQVADEAQQELQRLFIEKIRALETRLT